MDFKGLRSGAASPTSAMGRCSDPAEGCLQVGTKATTMKNFQQMPESALLIKRSFGRIKDYTPDLEEIADDLFLAAIQTGSVELKPAEVDALDVQLPDAESFEVPLPVGLSSFRSVLARIGIICMSASQKNHLIGRFRGWLCDLGVLKDKLLVSMPHKPFVYRRCSFKPISGSPVYVLDGVLQLRDSSRKTHSLKITMKNSASDMYLKMERLPA